MRALVIFTLVCFIVISFGYHQTDYKFILERYNLFNYDKNYVGSVNFQKVFITRHSVKYVVRLCLLKDIDLKYVTSLTDARKFQSNEYRLFPMNYSNNACTAVKYPVFGDFMSTFNCSFDLKSCYYKKGCYACTNVTYDDSGFPPYAPRGRYKLTSYVIYKENISLGAGEFYIEIKPTNPLERTIGI